MPRWRASDRKARSPRLKPDALRRATTGLDSDSRFWRERMSHPDTIVAAATAPGRGGVGVVRVSGPKTPEIAATLIGDLPVARHATLARFRSEGEKSKAEA